MCWSRYSSDTTISHNLIPLGLHLAIIICKGCDWELNIRSHLSRVMGKSALRSLSMSYPKKDWLDLARFFGYDTNYMLCCLNKLYCIVGVIPKEGLAGPWLPILLLVWQRQKILRRVFPWHGSGHINMLRACLLDQVLAGNAQTCILVDLLNKVDS